ncbi:MAG: SdiA-regulated domain-containing protein [Porticoccus sp.]|nr:SdiA-regulated domain-containing protein [Porticoccus sp.]
MRQNKLQIDALSTKPTNTLRSHLYRHKRYFYLTILLLFFPILTTLAAQFFDLSELPILSKQNITTGLQLSRYKLTSNPTTLTGIKNNASGLTFNTDTGTLFAIINNPEQLIELNTQGKVLRTIALKGFEDTEGLAYLGNQQFAIIEERKRAIIIVSITPRATTLELASQRSIALPVSSANNNGFEGITTDPSSGRLYIVNEKSPRQLIQVDGFTTNQPNLSISMPLDLEHKPMGNKDFSGIYFNAEFQTLLLLSDESKLLTEVDLNGQINSQLRLKAGHAGLTKSIPQAEGITLDNEGALYILSEPNLLYRFDIKS